MNTTSKQLENFSASHTFNIETFVNKNHVHEFHLKMSKDSTYEVFVLGKNGEPKPLWPVQVQVQHCYQGHVSQSLTTDKEGKLYLGKLSGCLTLNVSHTADGTSREWTLPSATDQWTYPVQVDLVQGSNVSIPVAFMWDPTKDILDRRQVTLIRKRHDIVIEDCFKKIKAVKKQRYFELVIENLEAGDYHLWLRGEQDHELEIKVHKGEFLGSMDNIILKKHCLQELCSQSKILKIEDIQRTNNEITVQLTDWSPNSRVHLMATNFVVSNYNRLLQEMHRVVYDQIGSSIFGFAQWKNMLMSDRQLSDEYQYVFDRQHVERQLGNTLDRPQLQNKRLFYRKTELEQEVLRQGANFDSHFE